MNIGSWTVLMVVIVSIGLALKATFFKSKKVRGGCCDAGDRYGSCTGAHVQFESEHATSGCNGACDGGCKGCPAMNSCSAVSKNAVMPIVKPQL